MKDLQHYLPYNNISESLNSQISMNTATYTAVNLFFKILQIFQEMLYSGLKTSYYI